VVQALAFAELVLGGLLVTSAVTGEPLGELLTKGLTAAGKAKSHGQVAEAGVEPSGTPIPGKPGSFFGNIPSGKAAAAIKAAEGFIGVKYTWGGTNEREGFDCSGLVQAVWAKVGVKLPRTAAEQYNATQDVSRNDSRTWQPGDLLFFSNGHEISHVGLYVSPGVMLDAPHPGASVGFTHFNSQIGSKWGSDTFAGIHRP
jgi:cell wall-associated NlpC family hydrolase